MINIVTAQLRSLSRFAKEIPMASFPNVSRIDTISGGKHAFKRLPSDQMTFGWVVNPDSDVTGTTVSLVIQKYQDQGFTIRPIGSGFTIRGGLLLFETTAGIKGR